MRLFVYYFPPFQISSLHSLGAGVESMTMGYGAGALGTFSEEVLETQEAEDCLIPMGITSENVAKDYNISRQIQDDFAAKSFQKAAAAQKAGKFKAEIIPITTKFIDPKSEKELKIVVDQDDGIRDGVTAESLAKLRPAFKKDGSTHAGKSSLFISISPFTLFLFFQETHRKYLMVLLLSCLPAVLSPNASVFLSSVNTSLLLPLVSLLGSWVLVLHMPSLGSSS